MGLRELGGRGQVGQGHRLRQALLQHLQHAAQLPGRQPPGRLPGRRQRVKPGHRRENQGVAVELGRGIALVDRLAEQPHQRPERVVGEAKSGVGKPGHVQARLDPSLQRPGLEHQRHVADVADVGAIAPQPLSGRCELDVAGDVPGLTGPFRVEARLARRSAGLRQQAGHPGRLRVRHLVEALAARPPHLGDVHADAVEHAAAHLDARDVLRQRLQAIGERLQGGLRQTAFRASADPPSPRSSTSSTLRTSGT